MNVIIVFKRFLPFCIFYILVYKPGTPDERDLENEGINIFYNTVKGFLQYFEKIFTIL